MTDNVEIKNHIKATRIIYLALNLVLIFLFIAALYIIRDKDADYGNELDKIFIITVPAFGFLMMFLSRLFYSRKISGYNGGNTLLQKMTDFRALRIIIWAMIESACFLSLVALMATANYLYAVVFILLLGYFHLLRPAKEYLIKDMQLTDTERDLILKNQP